MRKLQSYIDKYGPVAGPKLYHTLQSQAAHAGVSARLRKKIQRLTEGNGNGNRTSPRRTSGHADVNTLPLFPEPVAEAC